MSEVLLMKEGPSERRAPFGYELNLTPSPYPRYGPSLEKCAAQYMKRDDRMVGLTPRQRSEVGKMRQIHIYYQAAQGKTYMQIAEMFSITPNGAKLHTRSFHKMKAIGNGHPL